MKINHVKNSPVKSTDTDRLSDVSAMALEKAEELKRLCLNNNLPMVLLINIPENDLVYTSWNAKAKTQDEPDGDRLYHMIQRFVQMTFGKDYDGTAN